MPSIQTMPDRTTLMRHWISQTLGIDNPDIQPVSGDASFRRYFRFQHHDRSLIVMDAPPEKEDCTQFIAIAKSWREQGVQVPELVAINLEQGFLLLSDFGDDILLKSLLGPDAQPDSLAGQKHYTTAIDTLLKIQMTASPENQSLPPYDQALLMQEMALFRDWLVIQHLNIAIDEASSTLFDESFERLTHSALAQPAVTVHRDYHSRNLMLLPDSSLGIIDFQDAVRGPVTYDLVSLLRDCYIVWPDSFVQTMAEHYHQQATRQGLLNVDITTFMRWFDLMGIQRHLKAAGIFARLSIRDGKHSYLESIPDTVNYLRRIMPRHSETAQLANWIEANMVAPLQLEPLQLEPLCL